jgi:hypothetical protein
MFLALVLDKRANSCLSPTKRRLILEARVTTKVVLLILIKKTFMVNFVFWHDVNLGYGVLVPLMQGHRQRYSQPVN